MLAVAGVSVTEATGTAVTVMADVPFCPSLVAVIVAVPGATPVTRPLPLTVAAAVLLELHVITRPVSAMPFASFGIAINCTVCPTTKLAVAGVSVTEATGTAVTVMADVPFCPSLVAVIVAVPGATPVTRPLPLTVAAAVLLEPHVTTRPVSAAPFASFGIAVNWIVCPAVRLVVAGVTATDATGTTATVIADVPLCPSLVAVIVAAPTATAVTRPLALTVAAAGVLEAHVTTRPLNG